ncbi:MAG: restriction endonuclease subunit S [Paraclostridium sp.]
MEELKEGWKRVKLTEIITIFGGGTPKTSVEEYWNGNIPWLSVKDFGGEAKKVFTTEKKITIQGLENSSTRLLEKGDLIISARGTVGEIAQLGKQMAFNQSCYGLRSNELTSNNFLYYLLKVTITKIKQRTHGSVFDTITRNTFESIEINLPPLETQEKIASILSALDDKIEINNEMNKTLEEMAQTLFKRWFIDFDFQNENGEPYRSSGGKMVDSELGEIPEGWEVGAIKEIGEVITGKTPSTKNKENYGGKIPFITIPDMHGNIFITNTERYLSEIGNRTQSKKLLPVNSIIVSCIATVGLVSLNIRPSHTNQQINSIVPKSQNMLFYFFNVIKKLEDKLKMIGSAGTTTLNVNKGAFENIRIVFPNLKLMETYNNFVKNMYLKINENQQEIQSLIQIRDTLLPKLMSGEVEV